METASELEHQDLISLFLDVGKIDNETGKEISATIDDANKCMMSYLLKWLQERQITHRFDPTWGIFFSIDLLSPTTFTSGIVNEGKFGGARVMLGAHLDSDHGNERGRESLKFNEIDQIGLDDKTGVVTILSLCQDVLNHNAKQEGPCEEKIELYVYFSVGEEVGQKGWINFPFLGEFKAKGINYVICVDRITARHSQGKRHYVNKYCGVPLLPPCALSERMHELFNKAAQLAGLEEIPEGEESVFCSDSLEVRGRFDAEIVLPNFLEDKEAKRLHQRYVALTDSIREKMCNLEWHERVSSYTAPPRSTKYRLMAEIFQYLYEVRQVEVEHQIGVVNLSMDYQEGRGYFNLKELMDTKALLKFFICLAASPA